MSSLDDHIRSVLDRIRVTLSGQLEADLAASTADILRAVADEQRHAVSEAEERVAGEARLDTEQQVAVARADFDREREALQHGATAEIEGLERTLGEVRDELEVARRDLDELQGMRDELAREREMTRRNLDELQSARDALVQELGDVRRSVEDSRGQLDSLRAQLEQTARLTSAFRTLNEATSLVDILERLANVVSRETGRTAVFLVKGDKLRGWRASGFESAESIIGADFDAQASDVVGQAARQGRGQHHRNGDATDLPAFATTNGPRDAVALPVHVGGSVIAVLYADAARADRPEEPEWQETMDALAKHAGRVLEAMTVNQAAALCIPPAEVRRS